MPTSAQIIILMIMKNKHEISLICSLIQQSQQQSCENRVAEELKVT